MAVPEWCTGMPSSSRSPAGRWAKGITPATGETFDVFLPAAQRKVHKRRTHVPFAMVYQPALNQLMERNELTLSEFRILFKLIAMAPMGECIRGVTHAYLARNLDIDRHTAARCLNSLIERNYVCRDSDERTCLWVNPEIATVGDINPRR